MRRAILKVGDKSTNGGVVIEGVENCTHHGTPMTFIGAKVWCNGCKSEGVIGSKGPHRIATMMGKQQALDGDICICKCAPSPVLRASQDSAWHEFGTHELAAMGYDAFGRELANGHRAYDEQVRAVTSWASLEGYPYHIKAASSDAYSGRVDISGQLPRIHTETAETYTIYWGDEALAHGDWP